METPLPPQPPVEPELSRPPEVTVRYWAAARAAAGRFEERFAGATLADVLTQARLAHDDAGFSRVLGVSSLLRGDEPVGVRDPASVQVFDGDVIEVLPPFAGG